MIPYGFRRLLHLISINRNLFIFWLIDAVSARATQRIEKRGQSPIFEIRLLGALAKYSNLELTSEAIESKIGHIRLNLSEHQGTLKEIREATHAHLINSERYQNIDSDLGFRILDGTFTGAFGHMAHGLEMIRYQKELGAYSNDSILVTAKQTPNDYYMSLWKRYFTLFPLEDRETSLLQSMFGRQFIQMDTAIVKNKIYHRFAAYNKVKQTHQEVFGKTQTLSIPPADCDFFSDWSIKHGLSDFAWFVVLHVRNKRDVRGRSASNANLNHYRKAVQYLGRLCGAVVLIGDESKFDLNEPNVLNMTTMSPRDKKLEIILLGSCRFMIGTSSGPLSIPPTFGKSVLYTNNPKPWSTFSYDGYHVPKLILDIKKQRLLTFEEMSKHVASLTVRDNIGNEYERIDNDPDIILEAVKDMIERKPLDDNQKVFDSLTPLDPGSNGMNLAPSFLSRFKHLT